MNKAQQYIVFGETAYTANQKFEQGLVITYY